MRSELISRIGNGTRRGFNRTSLIEDIMLGMLAGYVGTRVIEKAIPLLSRLQNDEDRQKEQDLIAEPANKILANRVSDTIFKEQSDESRKQRLAAGLHYGYGILWGGLFGALYRRVPYLSRFGGIPFGIVFGLLGNEVMTAALRLTPPPRRFPASTHVKNIAAHISYAVAANGTFRATRRLSKRVLH